MAVWRDRAATRPVSPSWSRPRVPNGWSCLRRLRPHQSSRFFVQSGNSAVCRLLPDGIHRRCSIPWGAGNRRSCSQRARTQIRFSCSPPDAGLISMPDGFLNVHREQLVLLAARFICQPSIRGVFFLNWAGCCLTAAISVICFGLPRLTSIAFLRAKSQPTCRCKRRRNMNLLINLKAAKSLGLTFHRNCSPAPMR